MTHTQRSLFAKGLMDLANIVAGTLVFGQFITDRPLDLLTLGLGIILAVTFYLGALNQDA